MKTEIEQSTEKKSILQFFRSEDGNGFIEKIIIIGLFAFIVAAGVKLLGEGAKARVDEQTATVNDVNTAIE